MSDNQRFPVAVHCLAYLAYKGAFTRETAVSSSVLAASIPTNPVVVRRIVKLLTEAHLLKTCPGVAGGAWLANQPETISLKTVLLAVHGCAHLGSAPPGAKGCPVSEAIPRAINAAMKMANESAQTALESYSIADILKA